MVKTFYQILYIEEVLYSFFSIILKTINLNQLVEERSKLQYLYTRLSLYGILIGNIYNFTGYFK